jgi:hypothetical protein
MGTTYHPDPEGPIVFPLGPRGEPRRYRVATDEDMFVFATSLRCPVGQPLTRAEKEDLRREWRARQAAKEQTQEKAGEVSTPAPATPDRPKQRGKDSDIMTHTPSKRNGHRQEAPL